jgi:hypothetical protein
MFDTSYRKHNNFSISLFSIDGTHITCGVSISSKVRAKGSNITMPIYTDRYYVEIDLVGDVLKISDITLLSRTIEGEPAITTQDAGTTGFSKEIDLDRADKQAIEKLICDFSLYQLKGDTLSTGLESVIDYSISNKDMASLKEAMVSLKGKNKVVHLVNYMQGTSSYATVKCKEQYETNNGVVEATVTYDMMVKGNKWYIVGYNVLSSVTLSSSSLQTSGSLCLVSQEKVESYTSQVTGSGTTNLEDKKDVSKVFDYKEYTPTIRNNAITIITPDQMTPEMYASVDNTYASVLEGLKALSDEGKTEYTGTTLELYNSALCVLYNIEKNNYSNERAVEVKTSCLEVLQLGITSLEGNTDYAYCSDVLTRAVQLLSK